MVHYVPVRADARRNRDRILSAARDAVAETGAEATMDDIARRAAVAVGTLYRHFPAKEDLVAAVVEDSVEQIAALVENALAAVDSGAAVAVELAGLLRAIAARHAVDRVFKAAAGRLDHPADPSSIPAGPAADRAMAAITALLERARAAGAVRADVTPSDLVVLVGAMPGLEVPPPMRDRFVEIMIAGLAPHRTSGAR